MNIEKTKQNCGAIRSRLSELISGVIGLDADWVQKHVAGCPKCQRRLALAGKVNVALSIIKSRPHKLDLLMRANTQTVMVLKHSLRFSAKAQKLKAALPRPKAIEKYKRCGSSLANMAACVAVLFLVKTGIFSFMNDVDSQGRKTMKQYYAARAGDDLADEIFSA